MTLKQDEQTPAERQYQAERAAEWKMWRIIDFNRLVDFLREQKEENQSNDPR